MKRLFSPLVTLEAVQKRRGPFSDFLGVELVEVGSDFLKSKLTVRQDHLRSGGIMNGGVSLGIIETVGSTASACVLAETGENCLGIEVSANHLRTAKVGDVLTATARPIHVGRKMHVWEVSIENQDKKAVSSGRITMMIVDGQS